MSTFIRSYAGQTPVGELRPSERPRIAVLPPPRPDGPGLLSPCLVKSGYRPRHPRFDAAFNVTVAGLMLLVAAPLIAVLALGVKLTSRGPAFYGGRRLGLKGKVFHIYKLRTLHVHAAKATAAGTLGKRTSLETRFGSYLRRTRLDELPQLFNVVRRDMVLFGPRPIRPELLPIYEVEVENLAPRFSVRPGLIGFSQALLPHGASKRLRGRFNSMCCRAPVRYGFLLRFVAGVGLQVMLRGVAGLGSAARDAVSPEGRHHFLRSGFARPRDTSVRIERDGEEIAVAEVPGMSDEVAQFVLTRPIPLGPCRLSFRRITAAGRAVTVTVDADITWVAPLGIGRSGFLGYATLDAASRFTGYRLERYFLDQTVLKC